jgi:MFS family permease
LDHVSFELTFVVGIGGVVFGPILAGVLLIPPLVGCLLDRRGRASVAQSILLSAALVFLAAPGATWMLLGWRKADVEVVVTWWAVELLCVVAGATCMFVGSVLLDPAD